MWTQDVLENGLIEASWTGKGLLRIPQTCGHTQCQNHTPYPALGLCELQWPDSLGLLKGEFVIVNSWIEDAATI